MRALVSTTVQQTLAQRADAQQVQSAASSAETTKIYETKLRDFEKSLASKD
jgi:hypothetical protein